jgi:hypothetical protein
MGPPMAGGMFYLSAFEILLCSPSSNRSRQSQLVARRLVLL